MNISFYVCLNVFVLLLVRTVIVLYVMNASYMLVYIMILVTVLNSFGTYKF
jgi:hypothetical protein